MANRTDQPPEQPSLAPRPSQILAEPATVQACQADYAAAGDVRARMDQQTNGGRS
jgi:hypothetical protein